MTRTFGRFQRTYIGGYDLSGYTHDCGPFAVEYDTEDKATQLETCKGTLLGKGKITAGALNGIFDTTATSGLHALATGWTGASGYLMSPIGALADPAAGAPVFVGKVGVLDYKLVPGNAASTVTITLGQVESGATAYDNPWGVLLSPKAARTGANTAAGVDNGAASTAGGFMAYQVFAVAGTGTATISVDGSTNNSTWSAVSGMTVTLAHTAMPCAGVVEIGATVTVPQYTRWQLSLTGITSVTFALALVRGK